MRGKVYISYWERERAKEGEGEREGGGVEQSQLQMKRKAILKLNCILSLSHSGKLDCLH